MTDEARRAIENAKNEAEEKAIAEKFKLTMRELTDEELEGVAGGVDGGVAEGVEQNTPIQPEARYRF